MPVHASGTEFVLASEQQPVQRCLLCIGRGTSQVRQTAQEERMRHRTVLAGVSMIRVGLVRAFLSQNSLRPRVRIADCLRSPAQSGHVSEIHGSLASAAFWRSQGRLVLAVACGLALSTAAPARGPAIIILSSPRITAPPVSQAQPPAVTVPFWMPLPAEGPRTAPPKPVCYAGNQICALERPNALGGNCTCRSANGSITGRALIPPSRRIGGKG